MVMIGVIGIGNPLRRDDGIGIALVEFLQKSDLFREKPVTFIDGGTRGIGLLHFFDRYDVLLFVDAVNLNQQPGTFSFFSSNEVRTKKEAPSLSTHAEDVLSVISLAKHIHNDSKNVYVFGVQPKDISMGHGFSNEITKNLFKLRTELNKTIQWLLDTYKDLL